jgi:hypothetical protein
MEKLVEQDRGALMRKLIFYLLNGIISFFGRLKKTPSTKKDDGPPKDIYPLW